MMHGLTDLLGYSRKNPNRDWGYTFLAHPGIFPIFNTLPQILDKTKLNPWIFRHKIVLDALDIPKTRPLKMPHYFFGSAVALFYPPPPSLFVIDDSALLHFRTPPYCYWWLIMKKRGWKFYHSPNPNSRGVGGYESAIAPMIHHEETGLMLTITINTPGNSISSTPPVGIFSEIAQLIFEFYYVPWL